MKYEKIPKEKIWESNKRIAKEMKKADREFRKKQAASLLAARKLIINT